VNVKSLTARVKRLAFNSNKVRHSQKLIGMHMKKYLILILLAVLILTCAVLEGVLELPTQFVQINGLLVLVAAAGVVIWISRKHDAEPEKD
jgi:hypothetical protein